MTKNQELLMAEINKRIDNIYAASKRGEVVDLEELDKLFAAKKELLSAGCAGRLESFSKRYLCVMGGFIATTALLLRG